jgi:hypothetical protein
MRFRITGPGKDKEYPPEMVICKECGSEHKVDTSGLGPPRGWCCNDCIGKYNEKETTRILIKYGITAEAWKLARQEIAGLPSYSLR